MSVIRWKGNTGRAGTLTITVREIPGGFGWRWDAGNSAALPFATADAAKKGAEGYAERELARQRAAKRRRAKGNPAARRRKAGRS